MADAVSRQGALWSKPGPHVGTSAGTLFLPGRAVGSPEERKVLHGELAFFFRSLLALADPCRFFLSLDLHRTYVCFLDN